MLSTMNTLFFIITGTLGLLVIGWLTWFSCKYVIYLIKNHKISLRPTFRGFREKIWMTIGLGIVFFGFYFAIVLLSSKLITPATGESFFNLVKNHPIDFIYFGLFIVASITLSIYLVRMVIKYLFITKSKNR